MANIQKMFNEEIRRLAKKEAKAAAEPLQSQIVKLRQIVRRQNEQISQLQRGTKVDAAPAVVPDAAEPAEERTKIRMTSARIKKIREQCDVTQGQFAQLLGVSISSVSKWEIDCATPRADVKARIAAFGKMGKRELQKRLEELTKTDAPAESE